MYRSLKTVHGTWWLQGVLILIYTCSIYIYCVSGYLSCHTHHCIFCIHACVCVCACVCVLYLTLCGPLDCTPPGSFIHGFSRQEQCFLPCGPILYLLSHRGSPHACMHIYMQSWHVIFLVCFCLLYTYTHASRCLKDKIF